jgi:hypothetical protein
MAHLIEKQGFTKIGADCVEKVYSQNSK